MWIFFTFTLHYLICIYIFIFNIYFKANHNNIKLPQMTMLRTCLLTVRNLIDFFFVIPVLYSFERAPRSLYVSRSRLTTVDVLMLWLFKNYSRGQLTRKERITNCRICRGRRVVAIAFGILESRFRVLLGTMEQRPKVVRDIVLTCGVLHMLRTH